MENDIVVQQPANPAQLMLLFHGVGATPQSMQGVGNYLAKGFPNALIVSVAAAAPSDMGAGFQWFSIQGVTEDNRAGRVADAMPAFIAAVRRWQQHSGLGYEATALIGFSQGAIMALEAIKVENTLAGRVLSFGGRFAVLPQTDLKHTTIHLFHGKADPVMPFQLSVQAAEHLIKLGGDITAEIEPHVGHTINEDLMEKALDYLQSHIPKRLWEEALSSAPGKGDIHPKA
ncbi:MAG TPA: esterase [Chromobacteriaceae bacterium]|nr:esterase [Chromobacteriaceae bacterium]